MGISRLIFVILLLLGQFVMASAKNCQLPLENKAQTEITNWQVYENSSQLQSAYEQMYLQGLRLPERVFDNGSGYWLPSSSGAAAIPQEFIATIAKHITTALKSGYADFVFFPDMGHVHLFVPNSVVVSFKDLFKRTDIKFLYHTGELIRYKQGSLLSGPLVEDAWVQWRYLHRNLLGNFGEEDLQVLQSDGLFNTVKNIEGYMQVLTLYIKASPGACFSFSSSQQSNFFDISLRK